MWVRKARFTGTNGAFSGSSTGRSASDARSSLSASERALHVTMRTGWRQVLALLTFVRTLCDLGSLGANAEMCDGLAPRPVRGLDEWQDAWLVTIEAHRPIGRSCLESGPVF